MVLHMPGCSQNALIYIFLVPLFRHLIEILKVIVPDVYGVRRLRHFALGSEAPLK